MRSWGRGCSRRRDCSGGDPKRGIRRHRSHRGKIARCGRRDGRGLLWRRVDVVKGSDLSPYQFIEESRIEATGCHDDVRKEVALVIERFVGPQSVAMWPTRLMWVGVGRRKASSNEVLSFTKRGDFIVLVRRRSAALGKCANLIRICQAEKGIDQSELLFLLVLHVHTCFRAIKSSVIHTSLKIG